MATAIKSYKSLAGNEITIDGNKYYADGVLVKNAVIVSQKGRGKMRPRWAGEAWQAGLMAFQLGIVFNDGTNWFVLFNLVDGKSVALTYDEYLKMN